MQDNAHNIFTNTREFWRKLSNPSSDSMLAKAILAILVFAETLVCIFWIYTLSGMGEGYELMAAVPYVYIIVSYISLLIFYRSKRFDYLTFTQLVMLLVMPFFMQWALGGYEISSGIAIWAILCPIGALMILGTKQSTAWFVLFAALALLSWKFNDLFTGNPMPIPRHIKDAFFLMNILGTTCILYAAMRYFQSQKERTMAALQMEQARSEKLLLNILPASIAARLKNNDMRIADDYEHVSILFADLVGFTKLSANMPAAELVELLNQIFSNFDALATLAGLEKIKTMGDAYMVVSGAPQPREDHAHALVSLALQMQQALESIAKLRQIDLKMRIGIHSGPVVAGVIGSQKFSYDLWGDTVNIANQLEQTAAPNTIQISATTLALLRDAFQVSASKNVLLKSKRSIAAYSLNTINT